MITCQSVSCLKVLIHYEIVRLFHFTLLITGRSVLQTACGQEYPLTVVFGDGKGVQYNTTKVKVLKFKAETNSEVHMTFLLNFQLKF